MKCTKVKRLAGLFVEDDLPERATRHVECHIATCEECARFVREWEASQRALKTLRFEEGSEDVFAQIRSEVIAGTDRISVRPPKRMRVVAPVAVMAVICAILWVGIGRMQKEGTDKSASNGVPVPEPASLSNGELANVPEDTNPPLVVRWVTDDPDIVIIWIGNEKEQSNVLTATQQNT